jgi:hypothetical protein
MQYAITIGIQDLSHLYYSLEKSDITIIAQRRCFAYSYTLLSSPHDKIRRVIALLNDKLHIMPTVLLLLRYQERYLCIAAMTTTIEKVNNLHF